VVAAGRAGFTLVEAIVALALSSVLVVLVGTTFLVQNQYYALQVERAAAHDNARMVTELIASELRSTMLGGVKTAGNKELVIRSPVALAVVCATQLGHKAAVHIEGGDTLMDTDEITGVALRDSTTTGWSYKDDDWSKFHLAGGTPAVACHANGADTVGARDEFHDIMKLNSYFSGGDPPPGSVLMFYREVEYEFKTSELDPATLGLFRKIAGGTAVEFATGMDSDAQFKYRTGGSTYANSVSGANVANIDAIRIEAQARRAPQTGGVDDVTYGWGVNVVLRNR
jgi:prepilin-type N-terminal cleavage/methylation domain-containing protein